MTLTHNQRRERRAEIAEQVRAGREPRDVARQFGVSLTTVMVACAENSVDSLSGPRTRPTTFSILADLLNTQDPVTDIAARHNVRRESVRSICSRATEAGIRIPQRRDGRRTA